MGLASIKDADEFAAAALVDGLEALNRDLEIPLLRNCRGMERQKFVDNVKKMASDALASGSPQNNPRVPTVQEIVALYEAAW
jgi:alcohol dehydrogenase class IV